MQISSILTQNKTSYNISAHSKKSVLEHIAELVSEDNENHKPMQLLEKLIEREKLGSTGIGDGIAIPHCRIESCKEITGCLIKLETAIDFDAIDDEPVDIIFALIVPTEACDEHLKALASLAEQFSNTSYCKKLRNSFDSNSLFEAAISL